MGAQYYRKQRQSARGGRDESSSPVANPYLRADFSGEHPGEDKGFSGARRRKVSDLSDRGGRGRGPGVGTGLSPEFISPNPSPTRPRGARRSLVDAVEHGAEGGEVAPAAAGRRGDAGTGPREEPKLQEHVAYAAMVEQEQREQQDAAALQDQNQLAGHNFTGRRAGGLTGRRAGGVGRGRRRENHRKGNADGAPDDIWSLETLEGWEGEDSSLCMTISVLERRARRDSEEDDDLGAYLTKQQASANSGSGSTSPSSSTSHASVT
mmetsp:Transcript_58859/g.188020  ORF Transcript_58859/g.188020 Transcript_58859/m.188020 type:complete len:265 (+) Transcript_58859:907-1701(+)